MTLIHNKQTAGLRISQRSRPRIPPPILRMQPAPLGASNLTLYYHSHVTCMLIHSHCLTGISSSRATAFWSYKPDNDFRRCVPPTSKTFLLSKGDCLQNTARSSLWAVSLTDREVGGNEFLRVLHLVHGRDARRRERYGSDLSGTPACTHAQTVPSESRVSTWCDKAWQATNFRSSGTDYIEATHISIRLRLVHVGTARRRDLIAPTPRAHNRTEPMKVLRRKCTVQDNEQGFGYSDTGDAQSTFVKNDEKVYKNTESHRRARLPRSLIPSLTPPLLPSCSYLPCSYPHPPY